MGLTNVGLVDCKSVTTTALRPNFSCGGNLLMNVAPTKAGMITPVYQERLHDMGQWLQVNGEGIYASHPWQYQNDTANPDVW